MFVAVTGARGKVGAAAAAMLQRAGHEVRAVDLVRPVYERADPDAPAYLQADLAEAGEAFAVVRGCDAVVHAAAIPEPTQNTPETVFRNNLLAVFNVAEACARLDVGRLVNLSSETVPGFFFNERPDRADYLPVDEDHPARPQDPYALAKHLGEQVMDALVRRSDVRAVSIRPSWVQWEGNYERNLRPLVGDPGEVTPSYWSYIDVYDLADAIVLAVEADTPEHEVVYIASPDNAVGRPLADLLDEYVDDPPDLRPTDRPDASGISCAKARRLLGYDPTRSWRDYLDDDGRLRDAAARRLAGAEDPGEVIRRYGPPAGSAHRAPD